MSNNYLKSKGPLLEVLALLLIIIVALTAYGLAEEPIALGENIKQADVKYFFEEASSTDVAEVVSDVDLDSLKIKKKEDKKRETVDTSSFYVLFTGDSMTEQMRFRMQEYAKRNGHKLMTCIWYSSTTKKWSQTNRLVKLIQEYKPDVVIFTLGANELFLPNIKSREPYIKDIIAKMDTINMPFVWLGPPNWKDDTGINDMIKKYIGEDRFFYSGDLRDTLKGKRQKDGAHPNRAGAKIWCNLVMDWYRTESRYKFHLQWKDPEDTTGPEKAYTPVNPPCRRSDYANVRILKDNEPVQLCGEDVAAVESVTEDNPEPEPNPEPVVQPTVTTPSTTTVTPPVPKDTSPVDPSPRDTSPTSPVQKDSISKPEKDSTSK